MPGSRAARTSRATPAASTARGSRALICARIVALTRAAGPAGGPDTVRAARAAGPAVSSSGAWARRADLAAAARPAGRPGLATTTTGAEANILDATSPATTSGAPASTDVGGAGTRVRAVTRT